MHTAGLLLGGLVPQAQIDAIAFAFKDAKTAFAAMDGELGEWVRAQIGAKGIFTLPHPFDIGFRHITANKPIRIASDLEGLKIRVPTSPIFVEMFRALGASPTPLNVNEVYTALQTHLIDGEENAIFNIWQTKMYEVQKTLNLSYHSWGANWMVANKDSWDALGPEIQSVVLRNMRKYALLQRADRAKASDELVATLRQAGMQVYACNIPTFRAKLGGFYTRWKNEFGATGWSLLEKYAGALG